MPIFATLLLTLGPNFSKCWRRLKSIFLPLAPSIGTSLITLKTMLINKAQCNVSILILVALLTVLVSPKLVSLTHLKMLLPALRLVEVQAQFLLLFI